VATVNGALAFGGDTNTFTLNLLDGQTMTIQVLPSQIGFIDIDVFVYNTNNELISFGTGDGNMTIVAPTNQDYVILVSSINAAPPLNYTMTVTIQ